jgi:hypothetical protein
MDILGFRKIVEDSFRGKLNQSLFENFYAVIAREVQHLNTFSEDKEFQPRWETKVFTDNIVLGYPVSSPEGDIEFSRIVAAIGNYQLAMALEGFFIRGGLSVKDLFMDEVTVYGPALLEAYNLESILARDPRIVLSETIYESVQVYANSYEEPQKSPYNKNVLVDPDGLAYINYLEGLIYEEDDQELVDWIGANKHKLNIEAGLRKYYSDSRIWPKYYWLANYHNYFCEMHRGYDGYNGSFLVEAELSKRYPVPLLKPLEF